MSVAQAQREIDAREFLLWRTWFSLDLRGKFRTDYWFSFLCSLLFNPWREKGAPFKLPLEFFPRTEADAKERSSPELLAAKMNQLAFMVNAEVRQGKA